MKWTLRYYWREVRDWVAATWWIFLFWSGFAYFLLYAIAIVYLRGCPS